jgi:hypothetical protein
MSKSSPHNSREGSDAPEKSIQKTSEHQSASRLEKSADFGAKHEARESGNKRSDIVEKQVRGDMPDTARKRLDNTKDFHFQDSGKFESELKKRDPDSSDNMNRRTTGYHDGADNQAFVRDKGDTYTTALHEKLHQKSESNLSTRMNEGVTEYMAREKAGGIGELKKIDDRGREIPKPQSDYEKEVASVRRLSATVGDDAIKGAYFEGKSGELRNSLDRAQGEGSFDRLHKGLENRNYQDADKVFEKKG